MTLEPYDIERGRHDESSYFFAFFGTGAVAHSVCEPSRRPADGRYGENPNRLYQHHQPVIMKPSPDSCRDVSGFFGFDRD